MKNINLKLRLKNKAFWITLIPAVLLLIQVVLAPFGINFKFGVLNDQLLAIVNAIFAVLTILGVVSDPTVNGFADSERAMSYKIPVSNVKETKGGK